MAKLTLKPDATFRHTVKIPVPGGEPAAVEFVFKQRGRKAMAAFTEKHKEAWTADTVLDCAEGWDLAESFTRENVELLLENYPQALFAVVDGYIDEVFNARQGN